jgi:hypothetical protein
VSCSVAAGRAKTRFVRARRDRLFVVGHTAVGVVPLPGGNARVVIIRRPPVVVVAFRAVHRVALKGVVVVPLLLLFKDAAVSSGKDSDGGDGEDDPLFHVCSFRDRG